MIKYVDFNFNFFWYCSLVIVAREFLYYATKALVEDITPYIHIQGAHANQFQYMLPYPIGRLKNSVCLSTFMEFSLYFNFEILKLSYF